VVPRRSADLTWALVVLCYGAVHDRSSRKTTIQQQKLWTQISRIILPVFVVLQQHLTFVKQNRRRFPGMHKMKGNRKMIHRCPQASKGCRMIIRNFAQPITVKIPSPAGCKISWYKRG
jgi:hypothetical protein